MGNYVATKNVSVYAMAFHTGQDGICVEMMSETAVMHVYFVIQQNIQHTCTHKSVTPH